MMSKRLSMLVVCAVFACGTVFAATSDPDADYDRLDGKGLSGKKVDVIEWEGNLEIHVYPAGSLKGLALKIDKKDKNKPVMVIGYRFDSSPQAQLIRRAILGIDLREGFKAYRDTSADTYDKIVISNNGLAGDQVAAYKLDPEPTDLYPEGHPMRGVASNADKKAVRESVKPKPAQSDVESDSGVDSDSGTIRPFFTRGKSF